MTLKTSLVIEGDSSSATAALHDVEAGFDRAGAAGAELSGKATSVSAQLNGTASAADRLGAATGSASSAIAGFKANAEQAAQSAERLQTAKLKLFAAEEQLEAALGRLALVQAEASKSTDNSAEAQQRLAIAISQAQSRAASAQVAATRAAEEYAKANDRVVGSHQRLGASGLIAEHVVRSFSDSIAAGQSPIRAATLELGRISEAITLFAQESNATEGFVAKFAGFMGGPWGIAISIAVASLVPLIGYLTETGQTALQTAKDIRDAADAADSFGNAQGLLGKVIDLTTGKLKTQNTVLIEYIKLAAEANIVAAQKQQKTASDALKAKGQVSYLEAGTTALTSFAPTVASLIGTGPLSGLGLLNAIDGAKTASKQLDAQTAALGPLRAAVESYATAINKVDLSHLTDLRADQLEGASRQIGALTSGAIDQLDKLGKSGKTAGRDLIETKKAVLDLGKSIQDQIANQLAINAADGKGVSSLLKPYARPKKERTKKGPSAESLEAQRVGFSNQIAGIEDQYAQLPENIKKANAQLRELDKIKADIDAKPLLPGSESLKARIEALKTTINDSLNKPFNDYLKQQRESAEIDKLLIQGRDDEAAALKEILALKKQQKPLDDGQIAAILATVEAERKRALVLRDQRALIQANVDAVTSLRGALEQTVANFLQGKFSLSNIVNSLGGSAINILSKRVVEGIFGDTLRSLESQARGTNKVDTAALHLSDVLGKGADAVSDFATSVRNAIARIEGKPYPAANDNSGADGAQPAPANDNGNGEITVTAVRDRSLAGQSASQQIVSIVDSALHDLGIKLPPALSGAVGTALGKLERSLPQALAGAFTGVTGARLVLGNLGTGGTIGSAVGGAIGQQIGKSLLATGLSSISSSLSKYGGPVGSIIGGIVGGLFGGLFSPTARATSGAITDVSSQVQVTGTKQDQIDTISHLVTSVQQGLANAAQALGAQLGSFSVSISKRERTLAVDTTGQGRQSGIGVRNFNTDQEAEAIAYAISDAIADGAIQGLSAKVTQALESSTDINKAIKDAVGVQNLETALGGINGQIAKEVKTFEDNAKERLRIAKAYGFDIVQVEALNAKERLALSQKLLNQQVGSLQALIDNITSGSLFEGSAVDQRQILLDKISAAKADANAGVDGAADKLSQLLEQLNTVSKDAFGTTGAFAADQQSILDAAREVIATANQRVVDAQKASDPALQQTNGLLDEGNGQLAKIATYMGISVDYLQSIANGGGGSADLAQLRLAAQFE